MDKDYWIDIVNRLKDPATATAAAHIISTRLGYGADMDHTNLGTALKHVPREELLFGIILAYRDIQAQAYCDQILWYFEPAEIMDIYQQIENPGNNIKIGLKRFLEEVESPLANEV